MRSMLVLAVTLAAAVATALATPIAGKAHAADDQTLGMAIMSASVNSDGTHANQIGGGVVASA